MIRVMCAALGLLLAGGCVDEPVHYDSPCARFGSLLLCDRESGGADPRGGSTPGTPESVTCESTCQQLADCGLFDPAEVSQCASGCSSEGWPVECIYAAGCNLEVAEDCFGQGEPAGGGS